MIVTPQEIGRPLPEVGTRDDGDRTPKKGAGGQRELMSYAPAAPASSMQSDRIVEAPKPTVSPLVRREQPLIAQGNVGPRLHPSRQLDQPHPSLPANPSPTSSSFGSTPVKPGPHGLPARPGMPTPAAAPSALLSRLSGPASRSGRERGPSPPPERVAPREEAMPVQPENQGQRSRRDDSDRGSRRDEERSARDRTPPREGRTEPVKRPLEGQSWSSPFQGLS
jgi:hypothetical protein